MKLSLKFRSYLMLAFATFAVLHTTAFAYDVAPVNPSDTLASVRLSATLVQAIVSIFLPLVVGYVTNIKDSEFMKGILQLVLNAISAFIIQFTMVDGSVVFSRQTAVVFIVGAGSSLAAYIIAWQKKGLTSSFVKVKTVDSSTGVVTETHVPGKLSGIGLRKA